MEIAAGACSSAYDPGMPHSAALDESLILSAVVDRSCRRRQFVAESTAAPWAKHLRPGDRIETTGPGRATTAVVVEEVCIHSGYAGLDDCLKHPMRDHRIEDSRLFEAIGAAFAALQLDPQELGSAHPAEITVVVYTLQHVVWKAQLGQSGTVLATRR